MKNFGIKSSIAMLVKLIILVLSISVSYLVTQVSYGQKEKTFTAPNFGISMKYPADWTFIKEEQDFTPAPRC